LVAAFLLYQKEFFYPRLIAISFTEHPGQSGGFPYTKTTADILKISAVILYFHIKPFINPFKERKYEFIYSLI